MDFNKVLSKVIRWTTPDVRWILGNLSRFSIYCRYDLVWSYRGWEDPTRIMWRHDPAVYVYPWEVWGVRHCLRHVEHCITTQGGAVLNQHGVVGGLSWIYTVVRCLHWMRKMYVWVWICIQLLYIDWGVCCNVKNYLFMIYWCWCAIIDICSTNPFISMVWTVMISLGGGADQAW